MIFNPPISSLLCLFVALLSASVHEVAGAPDGTVQYILIFDAGSTGTRLNIYQFVYNSSHSTGLVITDFKETSIKPGLSAYKRVPHWEVKSKIRELMDFGREKVPKDFYRNTTVIVRATAGLRLLDKESAAKVSKSVIQVLRAYEFIVPEMDNRALSVITGKQEAEYGWVAVNFLMDAFDDDGSGTNTYSMLDLGGGSTQISIVPKNNDINDPYSKTFRTVKGVSYRLHAHSYLGIGAAQAKLYLLGHSESDPPGKIYSTPCLQDNFSINFTFGSTPITVKGQAIDPSKRFDTCYNLAKNVISRFQVHAPPIAKSSRLIAVASFFYTALGAKNFLNLTDEIPGNITIQFYENAAKRICENPPTKGEYDPYLCMDLVHIIALLKFGYKLPSDQTVFVTLNINGYSASWALGLAIHYLTCHSPGTSCLVTAGDAGAALTPMLTGNTPWLAFGFHIGMGLVLSLLL